MIRKITELVMYVAFSLAALPSAWLASYNVLYFRAHPEALEVRDSAGEALFALAFAPFSVAAFAVGAVLAAYCLVTGPRGARICVAALGIVFLAALALTPRTSFESLARVYWDGATGVLFCLLPLACGLIRARGTDGSRRD